MSDKKRISLFSKLFITYMCVGLCILLFSSLFYYFTEKGSQQKEIENLISMEAREVVEHFENMYFLNLRQDFSFFKTSWDIDNLLQSGTENISFNKAHVKRMFINFTKAKKSIYLSLRFFDVLGQEKVSVSGNKRIKQYYNREVYPENLLYKNIYLLFDKLKSVNQSELLFEGPFEHQGKYTFLVGAVQYDPDINAFGGAVIAHCDLTGYFNFLRRIEILGHPIISVSDSKGKMIPLFENVYSQDKRIITVKKELKLGLNEQVLFNVFLSMPEKILHKKLRGALGVVLIAVVIAVILIGLASLIFSMSIVKPLIELSKVTKQITKGQLSGKVNIRAWKEVEELADNFNAMIFHLQNKTTSVVNLNQEIQKRNRIEKDLRNSEQRFRSIINIPFGWIWEIDMNGLYTYVSPKIKEILGYEQEEVIGLKYFYDFFYPEERVTLKNETLKMIKDGKSFSKLVNRSQRKDGATMWFLTSGNPFFDDNDELIGYQGVDMDITEGRRKEDELNGLIEKLENSQKLLGEQKEEIKNSFLAIKNTAVDLEESRNSLEEQKKILIEINRELDDFTYIISHDLKEPLRSIDAFSKFVIEDYASVLDDQGKDYLKRIRVNAERMSQLIDDILKVSRVERSRNPFEECDVNTILEDAKMRNEYSIEEKKVKVIVKEKLPRIFCDKVRLGEVFSNIISNAVKFNDKKNPVIEVKCKKENDFYRFCISDNGPGVRKENFNKIFEIFYRLDKDKNQKGTGVGLAIVKRIIGIHKGRVWVESEVGKGTRFYFTIPMEKYILEVS